MKSNETSPPPIPDHQLLRRIGRGSYGEVWLARNVLGALRAVKILYRREFREARPFEREYEGIKKFEPISRSHQGFMDILHVGRNDEEGYFYYVMELADDVERGQNINPETFSPRTLERAKSAQERLPIDECVRLGLVLASALGYLHEQGLIHRDIKPGNIIFVRDVPKLADIGLVADIGGAPSYVGTEGFIPPEGPTGPASDLFSLGKVLYELATGQDRNEFPKLPKGLSQFPDYERLLEFNEVLVRACHPDLAQRYRSAQEMYADLKVMEEGKSVRRLRQLERRLRQFKRYGLVGGGLVLAAFLVYADYSRRMREEASILQRKAGIEAALGCQKLEDRDLLSAIPHLGQAFRLSNADTYQQSNHRLRLLSALAESPKLAKMWFLNGRLDSLAFSPDGRVLLCGSRSSGVSPLDVRTGAWMGEAFGTNEFVMHVTWDADGQRIASCTGTRAVLYEAGSWRVIRSLPHPGNAQCSAFSPDHRLLITACEDGVVRLWDASDGYLLRTQQAHDFVMSVSFDATGQRFVTCGKDGFAKVWRTSDGDQIGKSMPHRNWVYVAKFSPDGQRLATACFDRRARLWDLSTGLEVGALMAHGDGVRDVSFSPGGDLLATACWDGTARLWDARRGTPFFPMPVLPHGARVMSVAFHPDGRYLGTAAVDGSVRLWDLAGAMVSPLRLAGRVNERGNRQLVLQGGEAGVWTVGRHPQQLAQLPFRTPCEEATLDASGQFVVSLHAGGTNGGNGDRILRVWRTDSGVPCSPEITWTNAGRFTNALAGMQMSLDGTMLALASGQSARVVQVATGADGVAPLQYERKVTQAIFDPQASQLAVATGADVFLYNLKSRAQPPLQLTHPIRVTAISYRPDGRWLVACTLDESLQACAAYLWQSATGQPVGQPLPHRDGVQSASFRADGRRLATSGEDFVTMIWDVPEGSLGAAPLRHEGQVFFSCFGNQGHWLATASHDRAARLWDAESGLMLLPVLRHALNVDRVVFSEEGDLLTVDEQKNGWLWTLPPNHLTQEEVDQLVVLYGGNPSSTPADYQRDHWGRLQAAWGWYEKASWDYLKVREDQVTEWYSRQALAAERDKHWPSAQFYLRKLQSCVSAAEQNKVQDRLARAERQLHDTDSR